MKLQKTLHREDREIKILYFKIYSIIKNDYFCRRVEAQLIEFYICVQVDDVLQCEASVFFFFFFYLYTFYGRDTAF